VEHAHALPMVHMRANATKKAQIPIDLDRFERAPLPLMQAMEPANDNEGPDDDEGMLPGMAQWKRLYLARQS
jgi:hypothetical protein